MPPRRFRLAPLLMVALLAGASSRVGATGGEWVGVPHDTLIGPRYYNHAGIYDRARDRFLTFGGRNFAGSSNQVWEMKLQHPGVWRLLTPSGTPPTPRNGMAAAWDPVRDRVIVYGGSTGGGAGSMEVWALNLAGTGNWEQLAPTGTVPAGRAEHTMIYDSAGDRMIVYGGLPAAQQGLLSDVWALTLAGTPHWSPIIAAGTAPPARSEHVAIYDSARNRMIIHDGYGGGYDPLYDMWALALSGTPTWTSLPQVDAPYARRAHGAVYDSTHDAMTVFGGNENHPPSHNDVWTYDLAAGLWDESFSATRPLPRHSFAFAIDTQRNQMIVQGGSTSDEISAECWLLPLDTKIWSNTATTQPQQPPARWYHAGAYDPVRDRMIVQGGYSMDGSPWSLSLLDEDPEWSPLPATGTALPLQQHQMVHDPVRDRMLMIGGSASLTSLPIVNLNPAPAWATLSTIGMPPGTSLIRPSAIYDPLRDRILMFGGYSQSLFSTTSELWELSLSDPSTWTLLSPAGPTPPTRGYHTATYDPAGDRMLVYGGYSSGPSGPTLGDLWELSLSGAPTWSPVIPGGAPGPGPRMGHTAVLDAERSQMLVYVPDAAQDTVWALDLAGPPGWTALLPTGGGTTNRAWHVAAFDPNSDRMVVYGGLSDVGGLGDTWHLQFENVVGIPDVPASAGSLVLHGAIPNPSRGAANAVFTLPDARPARLEVFDLHGRRVAARDIAGSTGRRSIPIEEMSRAPAGLYLMLLEHGGVTHTARFVHVR